MNKKTSLMLSILGIISIVLITIGATYAFFNYAKEGTTENSITTGTIKFIYEEVDKQGAGISIENAYPIPDSTGKVLSDSKEVFNFTVKSQTLNETEIPYTITARKKTGSTLDEDAVKLYLTEVNGETETPLTESIYQSLTDYTNRPAGVSEKVLYTTTVPKDSNNYIKNYRLRMWIPSTIDFSPVEDTEGNVTYPYNDKTFTVTVNVYANAKVVTEEEIALENSAEINALSINNTELTKVENEAYDYETTLPENTTSTTINIETENPNATVNVEKVDSLAKTNNVKRLATTKTLELTNGENFFKVTVTSENKQVENEYNVKITVGNTGNTLSQAILNKYSVIETTPTFTTTSAEANENGLYKSTLTNDGSPTYYFRGNVENYIDFAGFTWRVVRINEDGTIRIVMQDGINDNETYKINSAIDNKDYMYYTNGDTAKKELENWYSSKIANNEAYANRVATGDYYCEAAKVAYDDIYASNSGASMILYTAYENPNFECKTDGNTKGLVNASVGLLSYDEVLHAGGYYSKANSSYYLYTGTAFWTMSPAGCSGFNAREWVISIAGNVDRYNVNSTAHRLRPVLNLKADTAVTGLGTSDSHWSVSN